MLNEVFEGVFSTRFFRRLPYLSVVAVFPAVLSLALTSALSGMAFKSDLSALQKPDVWMLSLIIWVVLFPVNAYFGVVLVDLCEQIRRGSTSFQLTLRGNGRKWASYMGAELAFTAIAIGPLLLTLITTLPSLLSTLPGPGQPPTLDPQKTPALLSVALYLLLGLLVSFASLAYFGIKLGFYGYAVVLDGDLALASLRKSWRLTSGNWFSLFGTFLLMGLVFYILAAVLSLGIAAPVALASRQWTLTQVLQYVLSLVIFILTLPPLIYGGLLAYELMKGKAPLTPAAQAPRPPVRPSASPPNRPPLPRPPTTTWRPPPRV